jgi:hypothetical protein
LPVEKGLGRRKYESQIEDDSGEGRKEAAKIGRRHSF